MMKDQNVRLGVSGIGVIATTHSARGASFQPLDVHVELVCIVKRSHFIAESAWSTQILCAA